MCTDPHNAVLSLYPEVHAMVYQDCVHCDMEAQDFDAIDSQETIDRLEEALNELGFLDYNSELSVDNAKYKLMREVGRIEAHIHSSNDLQAFTQLAESAKTKMHPIVQNLGTVVSEATVMGVSSMEIGDID
ncbi:hypothetical protein ACP4OV_026001 [Aristida adscensionis]